MKTAFMFANHLLSWKHSSVCWWIFETDLKENKKKLKEMVDNIWLVGFSSNKTFFRIACWHW